LANLENYTPKQCKFTTFINGKEARHAVAIGGTQADITILGKQVT